MPETGNELDAIDVYVYERLAASAPLVALCSTTSGFFKAFAELAPRKVAADNEDEEKVDVPWIVWNVMAARDLNALGRARIFTRPIVQVRAVTTGDDLAEGQTIADLIDRAMHNAPSATPVPGKQVMGFDRQEILRIVQDIDGVRWNYQGGLYRGFICRAS